MAVFNGFPATYQPMYYAPQYQLAQQQTQQYQQAQQMPFSAQQQSSSIIWVQNEDAAKDYLVAPNCTVPLYDLRQKTIYWKSADSSGRPSMQYLDYTIRDTTPANAPVAASAPHGNNAPSYATKADVEALAGRIDALRVEVDGMTKKEAKDSE